MTDRDLPLARVDRRMVVIGGALLGAGGIAIARQPQPASPPLKKEALEKLVPVRIGPWTFQNESGLVLPPPDALSDSLYSALVTRTYSAPDRNPVMLLVAYSNVQDGMLQVHRPEVCYPYGGYRLSPTRVQEVANGLGGTIPANVFSADGVSRTEQVLYWTRIGNQFPGSWAGQRLAVTRANLDGAVPDGILVRMSTLAPDMNSALPDLAAFAADLVRAAPAAGRRLIAGGA